MYLILFSEEEIENWKQDWLDEISDIAEIGELEDSIFNGEEFENGITLILVSEFDNVIKSISDDETLVEMIEDYTEVGFRYEKYLYRV